MKKQLSVLFVSLFVAALGCNQGNPGGPGVKPETTTTNPPTTVNKPISGESDKTFTLSVPTLSTSIKQGETKDVTIGLSRGRNFDQDVTVELSGLPEGVTAEPANFQIKHDEKEATIKLHAGENAALGDFTVKVVGHPAQGADATNDLKLTVTENK